MTPDDFALALIQQAANVSTALFLLVVVQSLSLCVGLVRALLELRAQSR